MSFRISILPPETAPRTIAVLTLDRPEKANAYHPEALQHLEACLTELERHPSPGVLIVESTGEGAFCAGADLKAMKNAGPLDALVLASQRLFTRLARLSWVSIAAIHGPAIAGGFELALACDLRVVGEKARFSLPEPALGLIPSAGGTTRLARIIGVPRAKEVILGGRVVDAETALDWGIGHRRVTDARLEARRWAVEVAGRDGLALRFAKELLDRDESGLGLLLERASEGILYGRKSG